MSLEFFELAISDYVLSFVSKHPVVFTLYLSTSTTIYIWDLMIIAQGNYPRNRFKTLKIILKRKTHNLNDGSTERTPNSIGETGQSRPWGKYQWHSLNTHFNFFFFFQETSPFYICSAHISLKTHKHNLIYFFKLIDY